jgi:hypothetical protein
LVLTIPDPTKRRTLKNGDINPIILVPVGPYERYKIVNDMIIDISLKTAPTPNQTLFNPCFRMNHSK